MQLTLATKAGKLPVQDTVRELLLTHVLPVLLAPENREQFFAGKGQNLTIGQDTFFVDIANDEGVAEGRAMISWSPNIWGPKAAKGEKKAAVEVEGYKLAQKDIAALDAAIAAMKANADIDNAVKLATIKAGYERTGTVSRDDLKVVMCLQ